MHYRYWNRYRIDTMADMQLKSILSLLCIVYVSMLQWNSTAVLLLCIVQVLIRRKGFFDIIGSISLTQYHGSSTAQLQFRVPQRCACAHDVGDRAVKQKTAALVL